MNSGNKKECLNNTAIELSFKKSSDEKNNEVPLGEVIKENNEVPFGVVLEEKEKTFVEKEEILEEKIFILEYSKKNYEIKMQLIKSNKESYIRISAQEEKKIVYFNYLTKMKYEDFKKSGNKLLRLYDNIEEIFDFILGTYNENKISIKKINNKNSFILIIKDKITGCKDPITFEICLKKNDCNVNDIVAMLCSKVNELEEIKKNMEFKLDHHIIKNEEELKFILNQLYKIPGRKDSKISLVLKYRMTENGNSVATYHSICNNIPYNLVLIKTSNGVRFGGYTDKAWTSSNTSIKDNNAFCFSLSNKKIYNVIENKNAITDNAANGPIFCDNIFCVGASNLLSSGNCTKNANSQSNFTGEEKTYEINDGNQNFTVLELEFYQVLFE